MLAIVPGQPVDGGVGFAELLIANIEVYRATIDAQVPAHCGPTSIVTDGPSCTGGPDATVCEGSGNGARLSADGVGGGGVGDVGGGCGVGLCPQAVVFTMAQEVWLTVGGETVRTPERQLKFGGSSVTPTQLASPSHTAVAASRVGCGAQWSAAHVMM